MFDQAAIKNLVSAITSQAESLGIFNQVLAHEPKSAPVKDPTLSMWITKIEPSTHFSGLNATAGVVTFQNRIYISMLAKPEDSIEADLLTATSAVINGFTGGFTLNGQAIAVDLLGIEGPGLSASFAYLEIDKKWFRTSNIIVPVILDDLWAQIA